MVRTMRATATWQAASTFEATAGSGHSVLLDSDEVTGGGNAGFRPLEMLLVGVGGCAGMVVNALLRRESMNISSYRVNVQATRAETHPMVLTEMVVEHELVGKDLPVSQVKNTIARASGRVCPVVVMMGKAVPTVHRYRVVDSETGVEESGTVEVAG